MYQKFFLIILLLSLTTECKKKDDISIKPPDEQKSYELYEKAINAMNEGDFFFAANKFKKLKISFLSWALAKASLMSDIVITLLVFMMNPFQL